MFTNDLFSAKMFSCCGFCCRNQNEKKFGQTLFNIPLIFILKQFDKSLRKQHEFYDHYRKVGTICEARVMIVRPGSFKKLQDFIIANSTASYNQFKTPKKLRTKATLDLMMSSVVDSINWDIRLSSIHILRAFVFAQAFWYCNTFARKKRTISS